MIESAEEFYRRITSLRAAQGWKTDADWAVERIKARDRAIMQALHDSPECWRLLSSGTLLSNVAHNLKQNAALDTYTKELLDYLQSEWDAALREFRRRLEAK